MRAQILSTKLTDEQIGIWYTGQVGFILKFRDKYLLIDGYLSDYVDRNCCELVEWKRSYDAPIKAEALDFIDFVFCTHSHFDHADPDTLSVLSKINKKAKYFVPAPIRETVLGYGLAPDAVIGVHSDERLTLAEDMTVTAVPSAHEELHFDANGDAAEVGFRLELGKKVLYHAGDCCPYDGLCERVKGCDVMFLPVNGRDYYRRYVKDIIGNFDCVEAVQLAKDAGCGLLVPMHFDLYDCNAVHPAQFVDAILRVNPAQAWHMFRPGERYVLM